jgi:hypothetical protein
MIKTETPKKKRSVPSNVKSFSDVPTALATVIIAFRESADMVAAMQATEVAVVHPTVTQAPAWMAEVAV